MKRLLLALFMLPSVALADIGSIETVKGNINIDRNKSITAGGAKSPIKSMDTVITKSNSEANIRFKDNTKVRITSNSRLLIDDFVYDPNQSDASKLALKVTLGTVRYASGQIAKSNPQRVAINTPTATISVRGTDFAMSVDEAGRSMIVMLPSCDDENKLNNYDIKSDCVVGEIKVDTPAGFVILNQAFTATAITIPGDGPTPPVKIDSNIRAINNALILSKPKAIIAALRALEEKKRKKKSDLDVKEDEANILRQYSNARGVDIEQIKQTKPVSEKVVSSIPIGPCSVFNRCWNERGLNNYMKVDQRSGSTIYIGVNERQDNTTYYIYQNTPEPEIKITGTGNSNTITIRQYDR